MKMNHLFQKILLCSFVFLFLLSTEEKVFALTLLPPEEAVYTPIVLTTDLTDQTNQLQVCVYDNTTLYIENGSKTIFQKYYKNAGRKKVKIAAQKAGTTLSVYLIAKSSGKRGETLKLKIRETPVIAPEPLDHSIEKPIVPKKITTETKSISVSASKGTTLLIKNDKETVKKVNFEKTGSKKIRIPKQDAGNLYFYLKKGASRSEIVRRTVLDVTPPQGPQVKRSISGTSLRIKGEIGADVYLKINNGKWKYVNTITNKKGVYVTILGKNSGDEIIHCYIKLKDASGNVSSSLGIDLPYSIPQCLTPID